MYIRHLRIAITTLYRDVSDHLVSVAEENYYV